MSAELAELSGLELAALIAARTVSPVEVVRAVYERLDATEPAWNCFVLRTALGSHPRVRHRLRGDEGHARPREHARAGRLAHRDDGPHRAHDAHGGRRRAHAGDDGGLRPAGSLLRRPPRTRLPRGARPRPGRRAR